MIRARQREEAPPLQRIRSLRITLGKLLAGEITKAEHTSLERFTRASSHKQLLTTALNDYIADPQIQIETLQLLNVAKDIPESANPAKFFLPLLNDTDFIQNLFQMVGTTIRTQGFEPLIYFIYKRAEIYSDASIQALIECDALNLLITQAKPTHAQCSQSLDAIIRLISAVSGSRSEDTMPTRRIYACIPNILCVINESHTPALLADAYAILILLTDQIHPYPIKAFCSDNNAVEAFIQQFSIHESGSLKENLQDWLMIVYNYDQLPLQFLSSIATVASIKEYIRPKQTTDDPSSDDCETPFAALPICS